MTLQQPLWERGRPARPARAANTAGTTTGRPGICRGLLLAVVAAWLVACAPSARPAQPPNAGGSAPAGAAAGSRGPGGAVAGAPDAAAPPAPGAPMRMRLAYPQPSASQTPLWLAYDAGLFTRYGLDAELQYVRTGNTLTKALMAREVDVAASGGNATLEAILQGIDLTVIASASNVLSFAIYGKPEVAGLGDLAGRTVGLYSRGSLTETALRVAAESAGLDVDRSVSMVPFGDAPGVLAALESGAVQAGVLSAPFTAVARNAGYRELVNVGDLDYPFLQGSMSTTRAYAAEQPAAVTAFLKAYLAGIKLAREDAAQAKRSIAKYTQTDDAAVLDESYRAYAPTWDPLPYATDAAIRGVLRWLPTPGAANADPAQFKDDHFLRELEASGFVRELYPSGVR
jgi:ABC-type nitrate/sulfonate/bicarbonate transport system substrate-binding protein